MLFELLDSSSISVSQPDTNDTWLKICCLYFECLNFQNVTKEEHSDNNEENRKKQICNLHRTFLSFIHFWQIIETIVAYLWYSPALLPSLLTTIVSAALTSEQDWLRTNYCDTIIVSLWLSMTISDNWVSDDSGDADNSDTWVTTLEWSDTPSPRHNNLLSQKFNFKIQNLLEDSEDFEVRNLNSNQMNETFLKKF